MRIKEVHGGSADEGKLVSGTKSYMSEKLHRNVQHAGELQPLFLSDIREYHIPVLIELGIAIAGISNEVMELVVVFVDAQPLAASGESYERYCQI